MDINTSELSIQEKSLVIQKQTIDGQNEKISSKQFFIADYEKKIAFLTDENETLKLKVEMPNEQIDNLRKILFAPKSEKRKSSIALDDHYRSLLAYFGLQL